MATGMPSFGPSPLAAVQYHHTQVAEIEEIRTIFVFGFPTDVKERELHNLLRFMAGYEASQMNFKSKDLPQGFALFSSGAHAIAAKEALQNMIFDNETNAVLGVEMAKKNLYVKKNMPAYQEGDSVWRSPFDPSKRVRTAGDFSQAGFTPPGVVQGWAPPSYAGPGAPQYDAYGTTTGLSSYPSLAPAPGTAPQFSVHVRGGGGMSSRGSSKDNPPCNTLYIRNLSQNVSEPELTNLMSSQSGFRQLKVIRHSSSSVCFVEFADIQAAMAVHDGLQGAVLMSNDRGGIDIQYSKNPFGRKRDGQAAVPAQTDGAAAVAAAVAAAGVGGVNDSLAVGGGMEGGGTGMEASAPGSA
eukprot:TRINITY_DN4506_c0_g1_i2.p1 TRINITY_DN4506_c0_g1~~TRINITY_DN4506_c0_g1_i2.p1  ORF type:complete len:367 (+),score=110.97 TRINITY_DN4506_c0_g1_i2:42-1103(+)